jgi:hypothetical protein
MYIAIVNRSTRVTDAQVATIAAAVQLQARRDVAPAWDLAEPTVALHDAESVPAGCARVYVVDTPDVADALGYHDEEQGVPTGFVFVNPVLDNGGSVLGDPANPQTPCVASVVSHEANELLIDSLVNAWADCGGTRTAPDGTPFVMVAWESCDPCEGDGYAVDAGAGSVVVSNVVLPPYFDPTATATTGYDVLGRLSAPFTMDAGGYLIIRAPDNSVAQVFGERMPAWKRELKAAHGRGGRRIAKR